MLLSLQYDSYDPTDKFSTFGNEMCKYWDMVFKYLS